MKLYLHCGYHKTGSSFLQTLFARNRHYLQKEGIHFPIAERELDMLSGNISPGNGPELASALRKRDKTKTRNLLESYSDRAKEKGYSAVLISCEKFFHAFENEGSIECLADCAGLTGFTDIEALIYFRDPESHALSTYKHRGKKGEITDFSEWLKKEYETMRLIQRFTEYRVTVPIRWTCRLYRADSEHLAASSFVDWLSIEMPEIPSDDKVNVSLSLSEILIIQAMHKERPGSIPFLQGEFGALSRSQKAPDTELLKRYRSILRDWLVPFRDLIDRVNVFLPENEKLSIKSVSKADTVPENTINAISTDQTIAFAKAIENSVKSDRVTCKTLNFGRKVVHKLRSFSVKKLGA